MSNQLKPSRWLLCKAYVHTLTTPLRFPIDHWQQRLEDKAFATDIETAWNYCAAVWKRPYVEAWCQLIHTPVRPQAPRAARLLARFYKEYGKQQDFILAQSSAHNPVLAAYAVQLVADPNRLSDRVRSRSESILLRDWHHQVEMTLGQWVERLIERHQRSAEF